MVNKILYVKNRKILVLASASPRRRELLERAGASFKIIKSDFKENLKQNLPPLKLVRKLALGKAENVARKLSSNKTSHQFIILAADTIVVLKNKILGKPKDKLTSFKMLKGLSGKAHKVITAYVILDLSTRKKIIKSVESRVVFRKLKDSEIVSYIKTKEPQGKAGGYAVQGKGARLIERIEGDYFNIVGLPIFEVLGDLKKLDL